MEVQSLFLDEFAKVGTIGRPFVGHQVRVDVREVRSTERIICQHRQEELLIETSVLALPSRRANAVHQQNKGNVYKLFIFVLQFSKT